MCTCIESDAGQALIGASIEYCPGGDVSLRYVYVTNSARLIFSLFFYLFPLCLMPYALCLVPYALCLMPYAFPLSLPRFSMFHPLTHIVLALEFALLAVTTPLEEGLAVLLFGLLTTLAMPARTETRLTKPFLKMLGIAALFLFLIHGIRWHPFGVTRIGALAGIDSLTHIAAPVVAVLYLSRQIRTEELFALLLDLRVPPVAILILFRTLWLVPRLTTRMEEVVTAMKLRGMPIETPIQRVRALVPALGAIFASMLAEISDNSLVIASRGFLRPGTRSHLLTLTFGRPDVMLFTVTTLILALAWY